jgi:hypothetical protein
VMMRRKKTGLICSRCAVGRLDYTHVCDLPNEDVLVLCCVLLRCKMETCCLLLLRVVLAKS